MENEKKMSFLGNLKRWKSILLTGGKWLNWWKVYELFVWNACMTVGGLRKTVKKQNKTIIDFITTVWDWSDHFIIVFVLVYDSYVCNCL